MVKAVFDNLNESTPKNHFTVGINDDVSNTSLDYDPNFVTEDPDAHRAMFWGLGADGTVGANKNTIKIIGEETDNYVQGYFVYDSKKAGSVTVSHLRFGKNPIQSIYLVNAANFVAVHQFIFMEKYDVLKYAVKGATFLLNAPYPAEEVWDHLPKQIQQDIIEKELKFYVIDGYEVAKEAKMGTRINTIMQTCFFAISGILPKEEAIAQIKKAIKKTYGKKGDEIVQMNYAAVDMTLANLHEVNYPKEVTSTIERPPVVSREAPDFVQKVLEPIIGYRGDDLPVSALPVDGTFPTATTKWEKRNIALEVPVWDPEVCTQCGKCSLACPNATIRMNIYPPEALEGAPSTFKSADGKGKEYKEMKCTVQVAVEDCTGCGMCIQACPAKNKKEPGKKAINFAPQIPLRETERENFAFYLKLPILDRTKLNVKSIKGSQLLPQMFEFAGNCSGCGETPYVKLMCQLFGDRAMIGNATGCSSIYGGNLPSTPYCLDANGRGPTWSNSLFEDCAEFSLGFRLTVDQNRLYALELCEKLKEQVGVDLVTDIMKADQTTEEGIKLQRDRIQILKDKIANLDFKEAKNLMPVADMLVKKSVWAFGGDGWAFDIGFGGLDHVLASGRDINVLVLDTGVYSNTGGQCSKATPLGAVAKFAFGGKSSPRKDMGMMAMSYGNVYVAQVAMGYSDSQSVKAFVEAESYPGSSIIIAYSHCIAHGINMGTGFQNQKAAVDCGAFPLYRFDPRRAEQGLNPLQLDSKPPSISVADWAYQETRFKMLTKSKPEEAKRLMEDAQKNVDSRWKFYEQMANMDFSQGKPEESETQKDTPEAQPA
jgi:pyruvate-ferredoxin/flavodoxin oxidoreductase